MSDYPHACDHLHPQALTNAALPIDLWPVWTVPQSHSRRMWQPSDSL